jgi:hypothetical protein
MSLYGDDVAWCSLWLYTNVSKEVAASIFQTRRALLAHVYVASPELRSNLQ